MKFPIAIVALIAAAATVFEASAALARPIRPTTFPLIRPAAHGRVIGWGHNDFGQATPPSSTQSGIVAVSAGAYHSVALTLAGTVIAWGWPEHGRNNVPAGLNDVVALADSNGHVTALRANGTVVCWGFAGDGRTSPPPDLNNVVAISSAGGHNLALRSDGTVVAWGWNAQGQTTVPPGLTDVVAVAAGYAHSLALKADGTVVAWGWNATGQCNVPAGLADVVAIAGGGTTHENFSHSLALKSDGTVVAWGGNNYGQAAPPAGLDQVVAIEAGYTTSLALRADGSLAMWGESRENQLVFPLNLRASRISLRGAHSLALEILSPPTPRGAQAAPHVVNGFMVGVNIVDPGFGYTTPPPVLIVGGSGSGASAVAEISQGVVTGFRILSPGSGYTTPPVVRIGSPGVVPSLRLDPSKVTATFHAVLGLRYQIHGSHNGANWHPIGDPFITQSEDFSQEFDIETSGRFFRIVEAPAN